jgi:hypothetical protein
MGICSLLRSPRAPGNLPESPHPHAHAPFRHPCEGTKKRRPSTGGALLSFLHPVSAEAEWGRQDGEVLG